MKQGKKLMAATFAGGCFWCTEAIFKRLKGVWLVQPGYSGGEKENPSYEEVSSSSTGHAEAIQIEFDPAEISYKDLLEVFFKTHDPTQLNKQGNDVGEQYRSAIFYHNPDQKKAAEAAVASLEEAGMYRNKIVTQIQPFTAFYESEDYHKDYYDKNKTAGYCQIVINPKITKFYKDFGDKVKEEYKREDN